MYGEDIEYSVELLSSKYLHLLRKFNCGNDDINSYLQKNASYELQSGLGVTKLILNKNEDRIIGFYTLKCSAMIIKTTNDESRIDLSPAVEIKFFAVDIEYQRMPYSKDKEDGTFSYNLFSEPISDIIKLSNTSCGVMYVIVYSVPSAVNFYRKNEFSIFSDIMKKEENRYIQGCIAMFFIL